MASKNPVVLSFLFSHAYLRQAAAFSEVVDQDARPDDFILPAWKISE